ncbi:MAG: hypothetical protein ACK4QP_07670 [Pseudorhizobium sp.]
MQESAPRCNKLQTVFLEDICVSDGLDGALAVAQALLGRADINTTMFYVKAQLVRAR